MASSRVGRAVSALVVLLLASAARAEGGATYRAAGTTPLFTRMEDFVIASYEVKDFDSGDFWAGEGQDLTVEGKKFVIDYGIPEGARPLSTLQIVRSFGAAIKRIGGRAFGYTDHTVYLNLEKDGKVVWARVDAAEDSYTLTIVERPRWSRR